MDSDDLAGPVRRNSSPVVWRAAGRFALDFSQPANFSAPTLNFMAGGGSAARRART